MLSVGASPDGTQFIAGGYGSELCLWDLAPRRCTPLKGVEFSSSGRSIKATLDDGKVLQWGIGALGEEVGSSLIDGMQGQGQDQGRVVGERYTYSIAPYMLTAFMSGKTGELTEKWEGGERVVCKIPTSLFRDGSYLISRGRHVVLWHEEGHLLHLDLSNIPEIA